jgi:serine phosphatase RsbU (regulator of sigma subunit)
MLYRSELQSSMIAELRAGELELVSTSSAFNGFRLSTRIMAAHGAARGGDWCETFVLSDDVVALSIGDVCGHGAGAFEGMLTTRQTVRDAAVGGLDPARTLANVNRALYREHRELYVTAIFGLLDTHRHTLTFANAGHPPPLMVGYFGEQLIEFGNGDLLLGMDAAAAPALHVVKIPAQTLLVFYTDGVIDYGRDAIAGQRKLRVAANLAYRYPALPAAPVIERQMFLPGSNYDDASILTARTPALRMHASR